MAALFDDPMKREVWETVCRLNDCWTKGDARDLVNFFHRDMVAITPTDRSRREGREACVAGWAGFAAAAQIHHFHPADPRIQLYGETAVVTYYYDMSFEMGGPTIAASGRDMMVLVKEAGRWWVVADQFAPYPQ